MMVLKPIATAIAITAGVFTISFAADYSAMTNEELSNLRGTMYNATVEERNAFRTEWQSRVSQMTPEERQKYMGRGKGQDKGGKMGGGRGKGMGYRKGGQGKGNRQ